MTVGDRLRRARKNRGLQGREMAELLVVDPNTISNYENDNTKIPSAKLRKWAEVTGVPIDWLQHGVGVPEEQASRSSRCTAQARLAA